MRRGFQPLIFQRDDALIAGHVAARIDGEGEVPAPRRSPPGARGDPRSSNRAKRPKIRRRVEIDEQQETGPSLLVCNWKRPSSFRVEPSSAASVTASATSLDTAPDSRAA